jgi:peptide/nickel transport system substrate-binding protein
LNSRRSRWLFLPVLIAGIGGFSAIWYQALGSSKGNEPSFGGTYVEGMAGAPARINPLFAAQNDVDQTLVSLIFAGLTRLDDRGQAFPDLAETWSVSDDGRAFSFRLRQGLIWQDGTALTAADATFTYELLRNPDVRSSTTLAPILADATIVQTDELSLTISLPQPFAALPAYLTVGLLPRHLLASTPPTELFDAAFNLQPVGAGPFLLRQLTADRAVLTPNPSFHFGQPYLERLELRFFHDDGLLMSALRRREIMGALFGAPLSAADRQYLEQRHDLRLTDLTSSEVTYVYLNLKRPLFQDRRLRQAFYYAIDREALAREVLSKQARPTDSPLPPGGWAYSPALERYNLDTKTAAALLEDAGWHLESDAGRFKNGQLLSFTLVTNHDPMRSAVAARLARDWQAIGVRVQVEALGATDLIRDRLVPRTYEAALFAVMSPNDPDPYSEWHSSQTGARGANLSSFASASLDRLLEEARLNASPQQRQQLYLSFQELFAQELPSLPLYVQTSVYVQSAELLGPKLDYIDGPGSRLWQVQEWYLKTH